ncbi:DNA repair protein RecO C-terminal domain-containing protein [Capnocytophaga canimorsus]|nr:DNA repair protein RecO C-terminal domain-containing protein [Capnocytophaga canimorsus]WGU71210.1 DNA repair protein RecO C-terminal domain-containing protein [Capnocytophaga canimorsus]
MELTAYLGFYPDKNDIENALFFNLEEGIFSDHCPTANYISGEELLLFKRILQASYTDLSSILINRNDRNQLLLHILRYYQWHFPGFKHKKSLDVLQMLFL